MPHALLKLYLLAQAAPALTPQSLPRLVGEGAVLGVILVVKHLLFDRKGQQQQTATLSAKLDESQKETHAKIDELSRDVRDLSADVKGTDGEGGIRAETREIKKRVIGLEDRERIRLEQGAVVLDRRRSQT